MAEFCASQMSNRNQGERPALGEGSKLATTFYGISLGNYPTLDPTEGNTTAENASTLLGKTFGSAANPLYASKVSIQAINVGGNATALDLSLIHIFRVGACLSGPSGKGRCLLQTSRDEDGRSVEDLRA